MQKHYKGKVTIAVDIWAENEEEAVENYFNELSETGEDAEVLDANLDVIDMDDTDDRDYYEGIEYANRWERENES